jgi:hypothetical protein
VNFPPPKTIAFDNVNFPSTVTTKLKELTIFDNKNDEFYNMLIEASAETLTHIRYFT